MYFWTFIWEHMPLLYIYQLWTEYTLNFPRAHCSMGTIGHLVIRSWFPPDHFPTCYDPLAPEKPSRGKFVLNSAPGWAAPSCYVRSQHLDCSSAQPGSIPLGQGWAAPGIGNWGLTGFLWGTGVGRQTYFSMHALLYLLKFCLCSIVSEIEII